MERENAWKSYTDQDKTELTELCEGYKSFLSQCKTERLATKRAIELASAAGYVPLTEAIAEKRALKPGDKIWIDNYGKAIMLVQIGTNDIEAGVNILGAHIDSPRLDLKQNPLYEASDFVLLDTHYYGGIKNYQWVALPLALKGVVAKKDGTVVDISLGDDPADPVFCVTDLLPHLSAKQNVKKLAEGVPAEKLNILLGSMPMPEAESENVKNNILSILKEKYGMEEEDFRSAEIEAVPAMKARSLGMDRSMVAAYGQDDRVCAYPALTALFGLTQAPPKTAVCILTDKEEIGSVGNTGMESRNFELFLLDLLEKSGIVHPYALQRMLSASQALSADVTAAYDPTYPEVMEKHNAAFMGRGISIKKYTGARGKSGASDANAEFVAYVRNIFEKAGAAYQSSELGKVDEGGGGTIAYILANRGMDVLDCGVPVHSMHSPYESASKYDIYMADRAYGAFFRNK